MFVTLLLTLLLVKSGLLQVSSKRETLSDEPIDVVYTWVNGSGASFQRSLAHHLSETKTNVDATPGRFSDKNELKYSLRSLEAHASWIRHIYIVTNGQVPKWLNLNNTQIRIVTHKEIFTQPDTNLPTFSSPAIEFHLHRINGLSKRFIYFNDDVLVGKAIFYDDFYTSRKGFLIYLSWPIEDERRTKLKSERARLVIKKNAKKKKRFDINAYLDSINYTNRILTNTYGFALRRAPSHGPILIDRDIMNALVTKFQFDINKTINSRFRVSDNLQFSFLYYYFIIHETKPKTIFDIFTEFDANDDLEWSENEVRSFLTNSSLDNDFQLYNCNNFSTTTTTTKINLDLLQNCAQFVNLINNRNFSNVKRYKYELIDGDEKYVHFSMITSNLTAVSKELERIRKKRAKFICLNDNFNMVFYKWERTKIGKKLESFYLSLYPNRSQFELENEQSIYYINDVNSSLVRNHSFYFITFLVLLLCFILKKKITKSV